MWFCEGVAPPAPRLRGAGRLPAFLRLVPSLIALHFTSEARRSDLGLACMLIRNDANSTSRAFGWAIASESTGKGSLPFGDTGV